MNILTRCYRAFRYRKITKSPRLLVFLSKFRDIGSDNVAIGADGQLVVPGTHVALGTKDREFLLQGITLMEDLQRGVQAKVSANAKGRVIIDACGVKVIVDCWEELFIAHEIFFRKVYNVSLNKTFRVVDIGMNTGTSALFFASNQHCCQVDAYELFPQTAERAEENFALNPELSRKIRPHYYGLGSRDETLHLDYYPEFKGSVGKEGLPEYARPLGAELSRKRVKVEIRAAAPIVRDLLLSAKDSALVLKLDCEGAEYEIVPSLYQEGLLQAFTAVVIEWHLRGPATLKDLLQKCGFNCLSLDEFSGTHGMLYGFKTGGSVRQS